MPRRPRPQSENLKELGFERQEMVRWLDPRELADAALRLVLSAIFGMYADKREQLAILPGASFDYSAAGELWLDFVADLGDGFDATYAVASVMARERLAVDGYDTNRGRLLVMGGDQVYPSADRTNYQNRLQGPYEAALPWVAPEQAPHLFAVPGNHDWYDGLTNFLRVFCQQGWIGGWQTRQSRSYFALKLPARWWLWGIDIQFDTYIDKPQLDYFRAVGEQLGEGDRVILVTGKPSWVKVKPGEELPDSYRNLAYFQEELVEARGARLAVTLTGDLHHYSRYADAQGHQKITWGGGGAYLSATHLLPRHLVLPDRRERTTTPFKREKMYPAESTSRRLRWGALRLGLDTRRLAWVLATAYALLGLVLAGAAEDAASSVVSAAREHGFWGLLGDQVSAGSAALSLILTGLLLAFAAAPPPALRLAVGVLHSLAHLAVIWLTALATIELIAAAVPGIDGALATIAVMLVVGAVGRTIGSVVFALYLIAADQRLGKRDSRNANNVFACQSIADFKGFLRLHIAADGELTIYPIRLDSIPRAWRLDPSASPEAPWFVPLDAEIEPRLIEDQVRVR